jgi:hypothetical protein
LPLSAPLRAAEGSVRCFEAPSQFSFVNQLVTPFLMRERKGGEGE